MPASSAGRTAKPAGSQRSHFWFVEQALTRLYGSYLTETLIVAQTQPAALDAACTLADPVEGLGLVAQRRR
jgi:hypothetical protein